MIQQIYGITLRIKEYQGKRVVTLADIDAVHERPAGTASRNFKKHRNHFIEGEDFYKVKCSEVSTFFEQPLKNEVRTQNVQTLPNGFNPKADIILITETGYLMLVKSFRDDLAWSVQRQLVSTYFQVKQMLDCESCHLKRLNTKLNVFMHEEFGEIRTIEIDGQIYFVGVDVARALEYKHPRSAVSKRVKPNHKKIVPVNRFQNGNGSPTPTTVIDESGLYSLVLASKCKGAEPFQEWVTSEVIPTIRKTGAYNPNPPQIETTQPIQQIEIKQEIHIEHVENLNISQKKEVFSMKNSNNQGVKRIHPYTDENGRVLAEKHIIKMPDGSKKTRWYAINPETGTKSTGLNGATMPLYHAHKLHTNQSTMVCFVEGEKDVETVEACFDIVATCTSNGGGSTAWHDELYNNDLMGKNIIILTDNDKVGEKYGKTVAKNVCKIANSVKIIPAKSIWSDCPEHGDISDIVQALGKEKTLELLLTANGNTDFYEPEPDKQSLKKSKRFISDYDVDGKGSLTIENLNAFLQIKGYSVTYDEILRDSIYTGFKGESPEHLKENAPDLIYNELQFELSRCSTEKIARFLNIIATRNKVNPIRTMIENTAWDGKDRLEEIYNMFGIDANDTLSRTLFQKWSMQAIAGLYTTYEAPFSLDIILVFQGEQGIAKTRFFEHLAINRMYFGEGYTIDPRNKDDIIQATGHWIVELGEIGSTMRKDMDSLKAFLTKDMDEYRMPYGRTSLKYPRHTSFVGTVNDDKYLIDETGSRRFGTIPIKKGVRLDYETQIKTFNSLQFWTQIYSIVQTEIKSGKTISGCFRLTDEEREALEKRNSEFTKLLKGEQEVLDILARIENLNPKQIEYKEVTVTEFKNYYPELSRYSTIQIGRVLNKIGIPEIRKNIHGRYYRMRKLPYIKYSICNEVVYR